MAIIPTKKEDSAIKKHEEKDSGKLSTSDLADVIKALVNAKKEYEIVREQEFTKRAAIESDLMQNMTKILAKREIILRHLSNSYSERSESLRHTFNILERALQDKNTEFVVAALGTIVEIIKVNPLKEIDAIGKAFESDEEFII